MNLNQYSNAAAQPGLAIDKIKFLKIPKPPFDEQIKISIYMANKLKINNDVMAVINKQIHVLKDYKKSLIHECVTGKRHITDVDLKVVA